jgi:hypothetical protein
VDEANGVHGADRGEHGQEQVDRVGDGQRVLARELGREVLTFEELTR